MEGSFSPSCPTRTISRMFLQLISPELALIFPATRLLSAAYKQHFTMKTNKRSKESSLVPLLPCYTSTSRFLCQRRTSSKHCPSISHLPFMLWPSLISFRLQSDNETALVKVTNVQSVIQSGYLTCFLFLDSTIYYFWLSSYVFHSLFISFSFQCCNCLRTLF